MQPPKLELFHPPNTTKNHIMPAENKNTSSPYLLVLIMFAVSYLAILFNQRNNTPAAPTAYSLPTEAPQFLTGPTHFEGESVLALVSGEHPDSPEKGVLVTDKGFEYLVPMNQLTVKTLPLGLTRLVKHIEQNGTVKYSPFIGQMFYPDMLANAYYDGSGPHGESSISSRGNTPIEGVDYTYSYDKPVPSAEKSTGSMLNPLAPDKTESAKDPNVIEAPMQPSTPTPAAPEPTPIPAK
jgi:hypothetical protein